VAARAIIVCTTRMPCGSYRVPRVRSRRDKLTQAVSPSLFSEHLHFRCKTIDRCKKSRAFDRCKTSGGSKGIWARHAQASTDLGVANNRLLDERTKFIATRNFEDGQQRQSLAACDSSRDHHEERLSNNRIADRCRAGARLHLRLVLVPNLLSAATSELQTTQRGRPELHHVPIMGLFWLRHHCVRGIRTWGHLPHHPVDDDVPHLPRRCVSDLRIRDLQGNTVPTCAVVEGGSSHILLGHSLDRLANRHAVSLSRRDFSRPACGKICQNI